MHATDRQSRFLTCVGGQSHLRFKQQLVGGHVDVDGHHLAEHRDVVVVEAVDRVVQGPDQHTSHTGSRRTTFDSFYMACNSTD